MKVRNDLPRRGRYRGVHQRSTHSDLAWIRRSRDSAPKRPQPSRFQGHKRSQNIGAAEARRWDCCRCSVQCRLQRNRSVTDLCNIQEPRHRQSGLSVVVSSPALRLVRVLGFGIGVLKQKTRFLFVVVGCGEAGDGRDAPSPSGSSQPGPSARCPMALPKPMIVFAFVQARGRALLLASLLSLAAVAFCCAYTLVRPSSFAETFLVSSATFMRVLVRAGWRCACRAADAGSIRLVIIQLVIQVGHA